MRHLRDSAAETARARYLRDSAAATATERDLRDSAAKTATERERRLQEENNSLRQRYRCKVCLDNEVRTFYILYF